MKPADNEFLQSRFKDGTLPFLQHLHFYLVDIHARDGMPQFREARGGDETDIAGAHDGDPHRRTIPVSHASYHPRHRFPPSYTQHPVAVSCPYWISTWRCLFENIRTVLKDSYTLEISVQVSVIFSYPVNKGFTRKFWLLH